MDQSISNQAKYYNQLVDCINGLIKVYRLLLDNIAAEKEILIKVDLQGLADSNKAKESILLKLGTLENIRIKTTTELGRALGMQNLPPRLLEIAAVLKGTEAQTLRDQHSVLDLLVKRVNELNKENEALVQSALINVQGAMGAIRDNLSQKSTYKKEGELNKSPQAGRLVSREA